MGHDHGHTAGTAAGGRRRRLAVVLGLTVAVLTTEVVAAVLSGSLALLADAGHMATDAAGIATRRGIMCIHREEAYADLPPRFPLPHSEAAQDRCILLPLFPQMTEAMQEEVVDGLREAVRH